MDVPSDDSEQGSVYMGSPIQTVNCDQTSKRPTGEWQLRSSSTNETEDFLELSFEEFSNEHPQAIKGTYLAYLKNSVGDREPTCFGLNDNRIKNFQEEILK